MTERFTTMSSLLGTMAKALNLIDPKVENHHQQTAYLAFMIAREAGFSEEELQLTIYSSLLHDIGFIAGFEGATLEELECNAAELGRVAGSSSRSGSKKRLGNITFSSLFSFFTMYKKHVLLEKTVSNLH